MFKGLFWVSEDGTLITYKIRCDTDGIPLTPDLPYNSRKGNSFAHKNTWEETVKEQPRAIRSKTWNHFPRGRVEIKDSKVTVYHNPTLSSQEFEQKIKDEFDLNDEVLIILFIPDHSKHYRESKID